MKIVLLAIAVWSLTAAAGYGQGSAADQQAARDYAARLNLGTGGKRPTVLKPAQAPSAAAQEKRTGAEAYDDFKEPYRTKFVESWEKAVTDAKKAALASRKPTKATTTAGRHKTSGMSADERAAHQNKIKDLTETVARLEKNDPSFFPTISVFDEWAVGSLGRISLPQNVVQVLGKDKMLVDVQVRPAWGNSFNQLVMFSGFATDGIADGTSVWTDRPIIVTKTTTYTTVAGSTKTVVVAEPLDQDSFKLSAEDQAARKKQADGKRQKETQAEKERADAIELANWRTWTDATGAHHIEAKFGGVLSGNVKLIKRDGSVLKLPLEKLSDVDQEWIKNRSK